jgi:hypothetical protein
MRAFQNLSSALSQPVGERGDGQLAIGQSLQQ